MQLMLLYLNSFVIDEQLVIKACEEKTHNIANMFTKPQKQCKKDLNTVFLHATDIYAPWRKNGMVNDEMNPRVI